MKRIEAQSSDSDQRLKRPRMSDFYDGPSTSQEGSNIQNMTMIGNKFFGCYLKLDQSLDSKPKVEIKKLDGFPSTPEVFVGRNGEREDLRKLIEKRQKVLITAIGGMGKTRLAIECARQWVKDGVFDRAVFINVETEQEANKRFTSLGKKLNVNPEVVDVYEYVNEKCSGLTLFVLDNVEPTNDIKNFLPPEDFENIKILATSQDSEYGLLFHPFNLNKLTEDKALELVKALFNKYQVKYGKNGNSRANLLYIHKKDIPAIQELMKELDGHPLALLHATALCVDSIIYNEEDDLSKYINTYLKELKEKLSEDFPKGYEVGYKRTVFASISLNVEKAIVKSHVQDFLFTMCFMNPTFIELKYFRNCGYFSEVQIKESKRALKKHSIIHRRDDNLEDIHVHRLVLFICLTMLRKKNLEARKDKLEAHIVEIIFGMYFGDRRTQIYHGQFLLQNNNLEKNDLVGPYINAFKKSHFMSKLSARLQRIDLTVDDLKGWSILHYCKFAEDDYWFSYFQKILEINESKNLKVGWPLEIVQLLKGKNVYLDRSNCSKTFVKDLTALHFYAAFSSDLSHFACLIERIEDAEIVRSSRLFNIATRNKNYHFGFELLERGSKYEDKNMALMCAVLGQNLNLTRTLIQEGAKVKFTDDAGLSPVFFAIFIADERILRKLQQHEANIESALNGKDGIKNTALLSVIKGEFVASHDYPNEEFHFFQDRIYLFGSRETEILTSVELLIKYGADLNCVDRKNNCPLMLALQRDYVNVARKLIEFGAEVNRANDYGDTPFMLAKKRHLDYSLIKLLEERAGICEGYSQSAPTPTASDAVQPEWFLNKYWKWRLNTCQEIQTHLEESQYNLKKLLLSTSDPSFKASIQDLDKKIEICVIGLEQKEKAIDDLDFSSFAKFLMYNLYAPMKYAIRSSEYGVGVLETLAEFIFETRFELPANLIDLYDKYVDIKIDNSALRSEKTSDNDETEVQLDAVRRVHQELAVKLLLPEEKLLRGLEKLKKFKASYDNLVRIGILTLQEGQLKYLNSSVAQYFLSEYLVSNFKSEAVQTMFLHKVLMKNKFKLTRQFFDSLLEQFFENEDLVQKKSDERHKQLNCLKRNRFRNLAGVELTGKVKETVRLTLQGDKDFLLLKRVGDEGRTHIIKYLVDKFENDPDILLRLMRLSDEDDIAKTYLSIEISKRTKTVKALLDYVIKNLDQDMCFLTLKGLMHILSSEGKTESLKVFLDFLKIKLDEQNLVHLLNQTNRNGNTVLHSLSTNADSKAAKVFLEFLQENLDKENLGNLLQQTDGFVRTALQLISRRADSETLKVFLEFLQENLDKENLGNMLQQTDRYKSTALHNIFYKADIETLKVFLEFLKRNLDKENLVNLFQQTDKDGDTALHLISSEADSETLKVFLEFLKQNLVKEILGNLLQQTNQYKSTALHYISEKADCETIKVLLDFLKENLNQEDLKILWKKRNCFGRTAVDWAGRYSERRKILLDFAKENFLN